MRKFVMCPECAHEYRDPHDRRFHAEPTACPRCGPQLQFWDPLGKMLRQLQRDTALRGAADAIGAGKIVAIKGIGGFQLIVDARKKKAVIRLRERKRREEKHGPGAVVAAFCFW